MTTLTAHTTLWENKNYVRLLSAQVLSLLGTGISSVCLALLAWDLAGEDASMVLSIAFALKMVAYIGLAPVFGALAPKLPQQKVMVALDIARALMFLCLPFVSQLWQIYVLMFCINACSAGFTPLFQSTLPQVLSDKEQYTKALSFSRLAYDLEQLLSPMLVAALLTVIGFRELFFLDSASFVVSGLLIVLCAFPRMTLSETKPERGKWANLKNGIQTYLKTPELRALWFAYLAASSASAMVIVNTVVYVHDVLQGGETQTAIAMALVGLGSMAIALPLPLLMRRYRPQRFSLIGLLVICIAMLAGISTPDWGGFMLMSVAFGIGMSFIQTPAGVVITESSGNADTTEIFAAHFSLTHFWWFFTYLAAGISAQVLGLSGAYMVMSGVCVLSLILYLRNRNSIVNS